MNQFDLTYKEHLYNQQEARKALQQKEYYYYMGHKDEIERYLLDALSKMYDPEDLTEWRLDWINIVKKIVDQLSIIYKEPAYKYVTVNGIENEDLTAYYNERLPIDQNTKDKQSHRFAKLFNTSLTQVFFDPQTGIIDSNTESSDLYGVEVDDLNPHKLKRLWYEQYFKNQKGEDEIFTVVWTDSENYYMNSDGEKVSIGNNTDSVNPYGIIPFPKLTLCKDTDFFGQGLSDVVEINETVNVLLTVLLNDHVMLGGSGTLLGVNLGLKRKGKKDEGFNRVRTGRKHPIIVEEVSTDQVPPSLQHVSTNPLIIEIKDTIDYHIKMVASMRGLNPGTVLQGVKDTSDYQKLMDAVDQLEVRRDDIEPCRVFESERFEVFKAINNYHAQTKEGRIKGLKVIPADAKLVVDFAEIELPKTIDEKWKDREEKEKRNMATPADWLIEDNPDLTVEDAKKILGENRNINTTIGSNKPKSLAEIFNGQINNNNNNPDGL